MSTNYIFIPEVLKTIYINNILFRILVHEHTRNDITCTLVTILINTGILYRIKYSYSLLYHPPPTISYIVPL